MDPLTPLERATQELGARNAKRRSSLPGDMRSRKVAGEATDAEPLATLDLSVELSLAAGRPVASVRF
jgi:hypothetical protein